MLKPAYLGKGKYVFISYAHKDRKLVTPFIEALQEHYNVWYDEGIRYGKEWEEEIIKKLKGCTGFLYLITGNSLESDNCKDEIYAARKYGKNFVNVVFDQQIPLPEEFLFRYERYQLCYYHAFDTPEECVQDLSRKCKEWLSLTAIDGGEEASPSPKVPSPEGDAKGGDALEKLSLFDYIDLHDGTFAITGLKVSAAVSLTIPEGVVSIADSAFEGTPILRVSLPEGLESIGNRAFAGCKRLVKVNFPSSLFYIGDEAFHNDTLLDVVPPEGIVVGKDAFALTKHDIKEKEEAKREAEQKAKEEAARKAKEEEAKRKAAEEADRKAKEEAKWRPLKEGKASGFFKDGGDFVEYGWYPQNKAKLSDQERQTVLQTPADKTDGFVYYEGKAYAVLGDEVFEVAPIRWKVLSRSGDSVLAASESLLDAQRFDGSSSNYQSSEIRSWMNGEFLKMAFPDGGQRLLTRDGTEDRVAPLSRKELEKSSLGFGDNGRRQCRVTGFAVAKGVFEVDGYGWYCTRNRYGSYVYYVYCGGSFGGSGVDRASLGARPSLRIKVA